MPPEPCQTRPEPGATDLWYALSVKPQHEKQVAHALKVRGFPEFLPLYKVRRRWTSTVRDVHLPLFPRYVFCRFHLPDRLAVVKIPGVKEIVGFGKRPVPVEEDEIEALTAIDLSHLPAAPHPFLNTGTRVYVRDGPLRGVRGILEQSKSSHRLIVSVSLLARSVGVEIDRRWVIPCGLQEDGASVPPGKIAVSKVRCD